MATSSIEWTDRVWNPTVGCSKVSAGCKHCYAERQHARLTRMGQAKYAEPFRVVRPWPAQLADPLSWKKPARIFVNSMSDLFHEDVPDEYIAAVFGVMAAAPQHTFQVLTKRAERMEKWFEWVTPNEEDITHCHLDEQLTSAGHDMAERWRLVREKRHDAPHPWAWPLPNVWLGVSVENQDQADARIPHLLNAPAKVRFLSCEPMLGPLDLSAFIGGPYVSLPGDVVEPNYNAGIDWVIVGGESGHGARPYDLAWPRSIIAQCRAAGVPVFHKQVGAAPRDGHDIPEWYTGHTDAHGAPRLHDKKGGDPAEWPDDLRVREFPAVRP